MRIRDAFLLLLLVACKRMGSDGDVKKEFATKYSCPEDRVTVKERPDVDPYTLLVGGDDSSPPEEVKKDPGRLAKWQADKKAKNEEVASGYRRSYKIWEATGCDHKNMVACTHADNVGTAGTTLVCQFK